jgi:hypothetical protein
VQQPLPVDSGGHSHCPHVTLEGLLHAKSMTGLSQQQLDLLCDRVADQVGTWQPPADATAPWTLPPRSR